MSNKKSFEYYLRILGATINSTKEEIRNAYYDLIKQWHPDKFANDNQRIHEATEKSKIINEAYQNLRNFKTQTLSHYPERVQVKSSNIKSVGYSKESSTLQIQFKDGSLYEYYKVPEIIYNELLISSSKGKFANRYIYPRYRGERVN